MSEKEQQLNNFSPINQQQPNNGLPCGQYELTMPTNTVGKKPKNNELEKVNKALNNLRTQHNNERKKEFPNADKLTRLAGEISDLMQRAEVIKIEKRRAQYE